MIQASPSRVVIQADRSSAPRSPLASLAVARGRGLRPWPSRRRPSGDGTTARLGGSAVDPDVDHDGLANGQETALGTDPFNPDTDGDGVPDGADAFPLDPTQSVALPMPADHTPPSINLTEPAEARALP